jgi:hypothetical protein
MQIIIDAAIPNSTINSLNVMAELTFCCQKQLLLPAQNNVLMNKRMCYYELFIISIDHEADEFRADGLCYCSISSSAIAIHRIKSSAV